MQITKTTDAAAKPSLVMLVYGNGGVGKTTFASTAPKPLLVDCENGAKYFGLRGIEMDVAKISKWEDMQGLHDVARSGDYETIIIDPIGELMEKLKIYMVSLKNPKNVMPDGSPTMAGWGWLKDAMKSMLKQLRDTGVNILLVAHVEEKDVEGTLVKRPKILTKISEDLIAFVDVVGYMQAVTVSVDDQPQTKRIIRVQPSETYEAKDRTNQLGAIIPPNFSEILEATAGTKTFKWSKGSIKETPEKSEEETPAETTSKKDAMNAKLSAAGKKSTTKKAAKK